MSTAPISVLVRVFVLTILPSATAVPCIAEADSALQACSEVEKVAISTAESMEQ